MAQKIIYTYTDANDNDYITDLGLSIDWMGNYNIFPGATFLTAAPIANAAGATAYTIDTAPNYVSDFDEKLFHPRHAIFKFTDGNSNSGRLQMILRDPDNILASITAIAGAVEALGNTIKRIDYIGEIWTDIYLLVAPMTKVLTPATRLNARRRYSGRFDYLADLGNTYTEKFSMQSDVDGAVPSFLSAIINGAMMLANTPVNNETARYFSPRSFTLEYLE